MPGGNAGFPGETNAPLSPPSPDPAFHWVHESWGHALRCLALGRVAEHRFTSAQLSFPESVSMDRDDVWQQMAGAMGVAPDHLMRVKQVHGQAVRVIRRQDAMAPDAAGRPEADALVSDVPGVALLVQVADCVPILMADRHAGVAAAVHAGWRGTCAGIVAATVETLVREFGCRPEHLVAALGPSIGPDDYEVGESVRDGFQAAGHAAYLDRWFRVSRGGTLRLDLWRANEDQLEGSGVPRSSVHRSGLSTVRHPDWFPSYRRDGPRAGRMAAIIVVPHRFNDER